MPLATRKSLVPQKWIYRVHDLTYILQNVRVRFRPYHQTDSNTHDSEQISVKLGWLETQEIDRDTGYTMDLIRSTDTKLNGGLSGWRCCR